MTTNRLFWIVGFLSQQIPLNDITLPLYLYPKKKKKVKTERLFVRHSKEFKENIYQCACKTVNQCDSSLHCILRTMEDACPRDHWCYHCYTLLQYYHKTCITSRSLNQKHQTSKAHPCN